MHVELLIAHHDRAHAWRARERDREPEGFRERETGLGRGRAPEREREIDGDRERGPGGLLCESVELRHDPGAGGGARDWLEGVRISSDESGEGGVKERGGVARRDDCCEG